MHETDHLALDGRLLRVFVVVHETGSVSRAAEHLGVNQSSISHALERLRRLVGDPLFVRSGRGITPTARADTLLEPARALLTEMGHFVEAERYDPREDTGGFVIAANDYEVETILRPLLVLLRREAPNVDLNVFRAARRTDWAALLRDREADLVLAPPLSSDEPDLVQQTLFADHHLCFYDPKQRAAPSSLDDYCRAHHAVMLPGRMDTTEIDRVLKSIGRERRTVVAAPSFAMLATLIADTDIVATMPSRLGDTLFSDFESIPSPVETKGFSIAQVWHSRDNTSPRHRWVREQIRQCSA